MKTSNLFSILISIFLLSSCGGGDDDSGPAGNSLTATVTGDITASFNASGEVQGQKLVQATLSSTGSGDVLSIVASEGTGNSMSIAITDYDGGGTYSLAITSSNTATFTSVDTQSFETTGVTAISGSIEITVNGDVINGAFNFDGEGNDDIQAEVSGEFSVTPEAQ
ncbi:DUF6252 family protein [Ekhidna sp. MALMAid0563]|uniref:DUF6252 family protein n=1 Tax=Ekhidna sp. MALMAid0563 TaxID=3143937 RepID=UPI0032DFCF50